MISANAGLRNLAAATVVVALALTGCGVPSPSASNTPSVPTSQSVTIAPSRSGYQEAGLNMVAAIAHFQAMGTKDVLLIKYAPNFTILATQWLDTVHGAEGVQFGTNSAGVAYCVVTTVNDVMGDSDVVLFLDVNADGMPDQLTRVIIQTEPGTQLCRCQLDQATGTLYVIDGQTPRVLRYADQGGDLIPDGPAQVFFTMSTLGEEAFVPMDLDGATANGVIVAGKPEPTDYFDRVRALHLTDSNGDSNADVYLDGATVEPLTTFIGKNFAGESTAEVYSDRTGNFEVRSSLDNHLMASFGSQAGAQALTMSRTLQEGETLQLLDTDDSTVLDEYAVLSATRTVVLGIDQTTRLKDDGGTFVIAGKSFAGNETVDMRLSKGTGNNWTGCTITDMGMDSLTVAMPSLSVTTPTKYVIRVRAGDGTELYLKWFRIWPAGS